jgi:hypothetical protein
LNGVLWGVSRQSVSNNPPQNQYDGWAASTQNQCGTNVQVAPDSDVNMCDGVTVESINDSGGQNVLAMYPRQPFNFAGRTGTIEFNVADNSEGIHAAWPTLTITDQPVPAPYTDSLSGVNDIARNSISIQLDGCPETSGCTALNPTGMNWSECEYPIVTYSTNYQLASVANTWSTTGCVAASTNPTMMNHVEIQINSTGLNIWATDAGMNDMREIGQYSLPVPLTQGLVWLSDVHYNASKFCATYNTCQQTNTFGWSDLAFDGPVEPRDLGFDVPDNTTSSGTAANGLPATNLGYGVPKSDTVTLRTGTGPTAAQIAAASGALLEMTYVPTATDTITYTINGHVNTFNAASTVVSSYGLPTFTIAMPVPVADIVPGINQIGLATSDPNTVVVANLDLILQGAGGIVPPG